jgi:hypothetical protein
MKTIGNLWTKMRSGLLFGIACALSPCCTPLIIPILISLLVGTPAAVWMSANLGWIYGGLTAISVLSLVLALRWMGLRRLESRRVGTQEKLGILIRDLNHVEPQSK